MLTVEDIRVMRARSQRLHASRKPATVADVVGDVFALQAQDAAAVPLGIWARGDGLSLADVAQARDHDRSIVRLWCLRGTLHLIAAQDVRWLLDLLRPGLVQANRARRAELGLDDDATARGVRALTGMLGTAGCLSRAEIAEGLARAGVPAAGQATIHVIWRAALDGLVCYGPDRDGEASFVLLDDWVPPPAVKYTRDEALAELARRYLTAYGPARPEDLAAWSGLSLGDARRGWAQLSAQSAGPVEHGGAFAEVATVAGPMWLSTSQTDRLDDLGLTSPVVRLLPAYDGFWLGYRTRDLLVPPAHRGQVYPGGGVIRATILRSGQAAGTWTRRKSGQAVDVDVDLFLDPDPWTERQINAAVDDLGRFLGQTVRLVI